MKNKKARLTMSEDISSISPSQVTRDVEIERGFIARTFYERGGKTMAQLFMEAKSYGIDPTWFIDPPSRIVWQAAEDLFKQTDFPSITLFKLTKNANRLALASKDEEENSVHISRNFFAEADTLVRGSDDFSSYVQMLKDSTLGRKTKEVMSNAAEALTAGEDAQSVVSRLLVQTQNVLKGAEPKNKVSIASQVDEIIADYKEAYHQIVELGNYEYTPGVPLPWRKLSYSMNGMIAGVYILAARPGVGKTSMALNFARYWIDNNIKVVFNSVDMDPKSYLKRQLSELTRISSRKMQFAKSSNFAEDIKRIEEQAQFLKELEKSDRFSLYSEYDIEALKANCSILKDQGKLDVLIIDYLQLMNFKGAMRMGTTQKTTFISNMIHEMAVELNIPILCLSQLNRDTSKDGGREPELSDLRDSGAIEQDAVAVMLLYRNEKLRKKWREEEPPVQYTRNRVVSSTLNAYCPIWLKLAKAREGDEGMKIPFVVVQNKYAWYQADYEADGDAKFARVYDDWRHDPIEEVWANNGALIRMADVREIERKNREIDAERKRNYTAWQHNGEQGGNNGFAAGEAQSLGERSSPPNVSDPLNDPIDPYEAAMAVEAGLDVPF